MIVLLTVVTAEGYCASPTHISPTPTFILHVIATPTPTPTPSPTFIIVKPIGSLLPLTSPSPTATVTTDPTRIPPTLVISTNPVKYGDRISLSGKGVSAHVVTLFVQGHNMNKKFTINSDGFYNGVANASDDIGITAPGSYDLYMMDTRTEVKSNLVTLTVISANATIQAPAYNATASPEPSQEAVPSENPTWVAGNYTMNNHTTITPEPSAEASADNNSTSTNVTVKNVKITPAPSALPVVLTLIVAAGLLLAMERSRKK